MSSSTALTQLDRLKTHTVVVADTGDFETMKAYEPRDATTNPSLILNAVRQDAYRPILEKVVADHPHSNPRAIIDHVLIAFGMEILKIVPGRVSTETDARLSFDVEGTVAKARQLIGLYEKLGVDRERILIKIASTWEGSRAAEILQKENIRCNMTLLFSLPQAVLCAEAGAQLISPFVGRIYDWYRKNENRDYSPSEDPGVRSVKHIYSYYKTFGYTTEVMGASFRNIGQILELAGCDLLTISPDLLQELHQSHGDVPRKLSPQPASLEPVERLALDEKAFRFLLNDDAMATEKLAEGIRKFAADAIKLEELIAASR